MHMRVPMGGVGEAHAYSLRRTAGRNPIFMNHRTAVWQALFWELGIEQRSLQPLGLKSSLK